MCLGAVSECATPAEVNKHLDLGRDFLARGQLSDALTHYHAAVGECPPAVGTYCLIAPLKWNAERLYAVKVERDDACKSAVNLPTDNEIVAAVFCLHFSCQVGIRLSI